MYVDDIDIGKLALTSDFKPECSKNKSLPRHKPGEKFLKGPIPWGWLTVAGNLPGKAIHVSTAIWFIAGMKNNPTVVLSFKILNDLGVKRNAAYRGLAALEKSGLVSVVRRRGRCPRVTINDFQKGGEQEVELNTSISDCG